MNQTSGLRLRYWRLDQVSYESLVGSVAEDTWIDTMFPNHQLSAKEISRTDRIITFRIVDAVRSDVFKAIFTYTVRFQLTKLFRQFEQHKPNLLDIIAESVMPYTTNLVAYLSSQSFGIPLIVAPFPEQEEEEQPDI